MPAGSDLFYKIVSIGILDTKYQVSGSAAGIYT